MTAATKSSRKSAKRRKARPKPRRTVPVPKILQGLPTNSLTPVQEEGLREMVSLSKATSFSNDDRIASICPEGSILQVIADIFRETTDIPLELPVSMVISFISALLLNAGGGLMVCGKYVDPFLWIILLSESGNGKTYTEQFVSKLISVRLFPQFNSATKFVDELSKYNRSLWLQDEFAQFLKRIQANQHMAEVREYILKTYDKSEIMRNTMNSAIYVPEPALTVLGMTVSSTFTENISSEMMLDGFMQRFQVVYADNDPQRPMSDFPFYRAHEKRWANKFKRAWSRINTLDVSGNFELGSGAIDEYETRFRELAAKLGHLPGSFFRRILWNANKLALVYHVILGKSSKIVDREDMKWAMNMTVLHLEDLRRLLDSFGVSDLAKLIDRGAGVCERFKERHGRPPTRREFCMNLKGVDNQSLMTFIMQVLGVV